MQEPLRPRRSGSFLLAMGEQISQDNAMKHVLALLAPIVSLISSANAADAWLTDFTEAQAQAARQNTPIVLDFTGSDWCGWCITMRRQVLDTPAFHDYARNKFVLMEVDLPRNTSKMSQELLRQNRELSSRYNVSTYPTVLVISAEGQILGGFTGGRTELAAATQVLDLAAVNAELLRQAATEQGTQKAKTLHTFYFNLPVTIRKNMSRLRQDIIALDPQNTTGIHTEQQELDTVQHIITQAATLPDDALINLITESLNKVSGSNKTELLQLLTDRINDRIFNTRAKADSLADIEAMRQDNLLLIHYCVPQEHRKQATSRVNAEFANPQQLLELLRQERADYQKYKK